MGTLKRERGFTLIEILVVIALIAFLTALLLPNTTSIFRTSIDSFARKTANIFREARDYAILMNRVVKIAIDIDKQEYWAEDAPASFLLPAAPKSTDDRKSDEEIEKERKRQNVFKMSKTLTKSKLKVPDGLRIHAVVSPRSTKLITEGLAEIYYFPHGIAEAAVIHLENLDGDKRSLVIHPVTGKTRLAQGYYFPSEERKQ